MKANPVISAVGFVTPAGHAMDELMSAIAAKPAGRTADDYALKRFKPAKYLTNRRMMKNVSDYHGVGMAAIELLKNSAKWGGDEHDPYRAGLFVGAPPASVMDHSNYVEPVRRAQAINPSAVEHEFGGTCMETLGTTLLTGLPNNVLCNGAIILNAKGKNDNYVMGETGAHYSLASAVRGLKLGSLDIGFAGGFSHHTDPVMSGMYRKTGHLDAATSSDRALIEPYSEEARTIFGDGAVFVTVESKDSATARGIERPLAEFVDLVHSSFAAGPFSDDFADAAEHVERRIQLSLKRSNVRPDQIGLVYLTAAGIPQRDALELEVVEQLFEDIVQKPAAASLSRLTGNLMEASGLLELATVGPAYADGSVPDGIALPFDSVTKLGFGRTIEPDKPYVLILRHSVWSDQMSCLLVRRCEEKP